MNMEYDRGNCRQFRLLTWNSFIGQFVHIVGGEGMGWMACITRYVYYFIRVHDNPG